jgi:hypothetical protein
VGFCPVRTIDPGRAEETGGQEMEESFSLSPEEIEVDRPPLATAEFVISDNDPSDPVVVISDNDPSDPVI